MTKRFFTKSVTLASLTFAFAAPPVGAWKAKNLHQVHEISDGVYEVVIEPGSGATQLWCAIADYAIRKEGKAASQPIYLHAPVGASLRNTKEKAAQFAYQSEIPLPTKLFSRYSVKKVGSSHTAGAAIQNCANGIEAAVDWPKR